MLTESSPTYFRQAPPRVAVSVTVDKGVYDGIAKRAGTLGIKPSEYFRRLVDAAWHARVCGERGRESGDAALDRAVKDVFLLADCEAEFIAESLKLPQAWVEKILSGWRNFGGSLASRDASPPGGGCPSGGASETSDGARSDARPAAVEGGAGSGVKKRIVRPWTDQDRATLQSMWAEGKEVAEIAASLGREAPAVQQYAATHRGLCPKRRGK